jgi:hypothetical protein
MDFLYLLFAVFLMYFGCVVVVKLCEYGLYLGDNVQALTGKLLKLPFRLALKIIEFSARLVIKKYMTKEEFLVSPILNVTPLELQQMRNNNQLQSGKRPPVTIEYINKSK